MLEGASHADLLPRMSCCPDQINPHKWGTKLKFQIDLCPIVVVVSDFMRYDASVD